MTSANTRRRATLHKDGLLTVNIPNEARGASTGPVKVGELVWGSENPDPVWGFGDRATGPTLVRITEILAQGADGPPGTSRRSALCRYQPVALEGVADD